MGQSVPILYPGTFDYYKIVRDPTGFIGVVAPALRLPKISMWHAVAAPHNWVKSPGPDNGPGSRLTVRELFAFRTD